MRVYLDDLRPTPPGYHIRVYTAEGAIDVLSSTHVTEISLDNDLGLPDGPMSEGRHVADWIEKAAYFGIIPPCKVTIHSANPVARRAMEAAISKANEHWERNRNVS